MAATALGGWKLAQLKHAAFLSGLPSTGTKAAIIATLEAPTAFVAPRTSGSRILSVDMGIRNLAYCVVEVPGIKKSPGTLDTAGPLTVTEWKKIDLLRSAGQSPEPLPHHKDIKSAAIVPERKTKPRVVNQVPASVFTPAELSKTAYRVTRELLKYKPTAILIERQRFRSGGAAAIQEWTVRVNMLESMLWACLQTLRESSGPRTESFPTTHEVNPARVAAFWTSDSAV
ncbi:hypothetical protein LTR53_016882, partial [Teratosphaeriaceae sp. CCFEE 6253]